MTETSSATAALRDITLATLADTAKAMAEAEVMNLADIQTAAATIQSASVSALVYVGDQIRELVEQQKLASVLAAIDRTDGADTALLGWNIEQKAADYVRARIGEIVTPGSETE